MAKKSKKGIQPLGEEIVDFHEERELMVKYILETWDGNPEYLRTVVEKGFEAGYEAAKYWVGKSDGLSLIHSIEKYSEKRKEHLDKNNLSQFYDEIYAIGKNILMNTMYYEREIINEFNFEKETNKLCSELIKEIGKENIFPKGWDKVKKSKKSAYEYFDSFSLKTEELFKGHDSQSAGAGGFEHRSNLASVYYGVTEQGRKILNELYGAAFAHGLYIRDNNNSIQLSKDYEDLMQNYTNEKYPNVTYLGDLTKLSSNNILNALMIDKHALSHPKPYSSQKEMENFIEEEKNNSEKYGMVSFNMFGSDDHFHSGFKIQKIYTFEHFKESLLKKVDEFFKDGDEKEIYYSDNNFSMISKEDVLAAIKFKEVSRKDFLSLSNVFEEKNEISYGESFDFFNYTYPNKKELSEMNAKKMKEMLKDLMDFLKPVDPEVQKREENVNKKYQDLVWSVLKREGNKEKLKM